MRCLDTAATPHAFLPAVGATTFGAVTRCAARLVVTSGPMTPPPDRLRAALADRYRIERELGVGGMATVYLAQDVKHDRKVAVKVLKPELAAVLGAERFVVEIRTTAALQHPHILPLFDSGEADGFLYYVMPFVDGETLRAKLDRETQLGVDDAVRMATDVADALHYAHTHGVIHRDIKPENILLANGRPMVADFGIALAVSAAAGGRMTETGLSLGTPHYMSPEQATAEKEISARSDVYSLASVLYEMLAGQPPHLGGSAQQIIMKIITEQAAVVTTLRRSVPAHVAAALARALEKLPADRFESAHDFARALADPGFRYGTQGTTTSGSASGRDPWRIGLAAVALLAVGWALWATFRGARAPEGELARFALATPVGQELVGPGGTRVAFAPDGRSFVYTGVGPRGPQLWLRRMSELAATPIAGTEGASSPAFSPDGREIGFITLTPFALKVVSIDGGRPRTVLSDRASGGGLAWASNGDIFADVGNGFARLRPDGSGLTMVMTLDSTGAETGAAWPEALPDGRGLLLRVRRGGEPLANYSIIAIDLKTGARKELVRGLVARYSPTGHLVWITGEGALRAQRFDLARLELTGDPVTLWSGFLVGGFGAADLVLSRDGDAIHTAGAVRTTISNVVWVSRAGAISRIDTVTVDGLISSAVLSPSGASAALVIVRATTGSDLTRVWVKRIDGGPTQLVTSELANSRNPIWDAAGRDLLYTSLGGQLVRRRRSDGSGAPVDLLREPRGVVALTMAPDGKTVVLATASDGPARNDLRAFRPGIDSVSTPVLTSPAVETDPAFSPDGRWLAYSSSETGRYEVYVSPFPDVQSAKIQVSTQGGVLPRWNPRGGELFFIDATGDLTVARVSAASGFSVTRVDRLFSTSRLGSTSIYDVSPDGRRFLMLDGSSGSGDASAGHIVVVPNFAAELRRKLP